jgi:hypothetical protein
LENHTEEAREHIKMILTGISLQQLIQKNYLNTLSTQGLATIYIPHVQCIEQLNTFKVQGKPFEYTLFSTLGHNTFFQRRYYRPLIFQFNG